jgi:hypothetical protein
MSQYKKNNINMSSIYKYLDVDDNDDSPVEEHQDNKDDYDKQYNVVPNNFTKSVDNASNWEKVKGNPQKKNKHSKPFNKKPKEEYRHENKQEIKQDTKQEIRQDTKQEIKQEQIEEHNDNKIIDSNISEFKFQNKWYVWIHEVDSKDWSIKSYKIIHEIGDMQGFWEFFNNIYKLNQWKYNFFVMKANSHPTWEHSTNRNGGTCSIRIDISQSIDIIEQLAILLVNESLTEEINDINGISFAAKGNWSVIKIWNKDNKNNISNQMPSYLRKIYPAISIKYKENIPEY